MIRLGIGSSIFRYWSTICENFQGKAAVTFFKQTPLYDLHRRLGAKMTEFAGFLMPLQFGKGIIHEHLHCRSLAGLFDISHMGQCHIAGGSVGEALDKLTLGGIANLKIGGQKYTVLTNDQGGVIDDIVVTRDESGLGIIVNAACKAKDFAWLRQKMPADCSLQDCADLALLALQGPKAQVIIEKFSVEAACLPFMHACVTTIEGIVCKVSRSGYTGEDGFEISLYKDDAECLAEILLAEDGVEPMGLGARDTLRLEAGLCLYGHELDETITPIEAGLRWLLRTDHDDFPGAEKILAQYHTGPARLRAGFLVEGRIPVRRGSTIVDHECHPVGYVTSGSFSPCLNRPIAMAMVDKRHAFVGSALFALVRGSSVPIVACPLPFVPHRYRR